MGKANFFYTTFAKYADFTDVEFHDSARFLLAHFGKGTEFTRAKFYAVAGFPSSYFGDFAGFGALEFKSNISFSMAVFKKGAYFSLDVIGGPAYFNDASFDGDIIFRGGRGRIIKRITIDLTNVTINKNCRLYFRNLDLGDSAFAHNEGIIDASFVNVSWEGGNYSRRKHTRDETLAKMADSDITYEVAAEVYRRLRRNFENRLSYAEAGDFHIGEMEMRRLGFKEKGWKRIFNWTYIFLQAYRWAGGYGERIRNPVISFLTIGIVFAGLWSLIGFPVPEGEGVKITHNFGLAILFSLKTFLTLPGKAFCLVQEVVGAFQRAFGVGIITLFILALRRAFRR